MTTTEKYVPNARDATVGFFGRAAHGWRERCVVCNDKAPLEQTSRIYGDLYVSEPAPKERVETVDACDMCGVTFYKLSQMCQAEHDEQQARWARLPITHVIEMGMVGAVRCRIY